MTNTLTRTASAAETHKPNCRPPYTMIHVPEADYMTSRLVGGGSTHPYHDVRKIRVFRCQCCGYMKSYDDKLKDGKHGVQGIGRLLPRNTPAG